MFQGAYGVGFAGQSLQFRVLAHGHRHQRILVHDVELARWFVHRSVAQIGRSPPHQAGQAVTVQVELLFGVEQCLLGLGQEKFGIGNLAGPDHTGFGPQFGIGQEGFGPVADDAGHGMVAFGGEQFPVQDFHVGSHRQQGAVIAGAGGFQVALGKTEVAAGRRAKALEQGLTHRQRAEGLILGIQ